MTQSIIYGWYETDALSKIHFSEIVARPVSKKQEDYIIIMKQVLFHSDNKKDLSENKCQLQSTKKCQNILLENAREKREGKKNPHSTRREKKIGKNTYTQKERKREKHRKISRETKNDYGCTNVNKMYECIHLKK